MLLDSVYTKLLRSTWAPVIELTFPIAISRESPTKMQTTSSSDLKEGDPKSRADAEGEVLEAHRSDLRVHSH